MSDLATTYALQVGVPLTKPTIQESFFPLDHPLDKTILIHGFGGAIVQNQQNQLVASFPAKVFDHFGEVVLLLKPLVEPLGYKLFQIGAQGEPPIPGVEQLVGKTSILQCTYLVKRAALLIGNDSLWAHQRGAFDGALVALYGPTSKPHFPHWRNEAKTALIESHRAGKRPSFQSNENPKTINWITPESVANAALALLGVGPVSRCSLCLGPLYNQPIVEVIPNLVVNPQLQLAAPPILRMDLLHDEKVMAQNLQLRKCAIITSKEIDLAVLTQLKPNIISIRVEIDQVSPDWIKQLKRLGIRTAFMAVEKDDAKILQMRMDYYDACQFDRFNAPTKEDWLKSVETYCQKPLDTSTKLDTIQFKTQKLILSDNQIYLSHAHWKAGRPAKSAQENSDTVIDTPLFWEETEHCYFYTTTS